VHSEIAGQGNLVTGNWFTASVILIRLLRFNSQLLRDVTNNKMTRA
jgi:hypothetical protein